MIYDYIMEIIQQDNKILRKVSKQVPIQDIKSKEVQKILSDMKIALDSQEDGVAIAAPQIGISLRIFIVSEKAYSIEKDTDEQKNKVYKKDFIFINPEIIKLSKKKQSLEEGCLSVRWLYGDVVRSTNAIIRAYNEKGELFTRGAGGLLAQIFQHEVDHLDGVLFIDKAKNIEEIQPNQL